MSELIFTQISNMKKYREKLEQLVYPLTEMQMETIPAGHKNNIIWNLGHILSTQQILSYERSGLSTWVQADLLEPFRKGTFPQPGASSLLPELLKLWIPSLEQLREDYFNGKFAKFDPYTTSAGISLNSIEDSILFNSIHESLHHGIVLSMLKKISSKHL